MKKVILIPLKIVAFTVIFFILSFFAAVLFKDNTNSYYRVLIHEFYNQEKIDWLICGASHVSHGLDPNQAETIINKKVFNTGTPSQQLNGTYAVIQQALKTHNLEKIFVELDFATANLALPEENSGFKADYIVGEFIHNPILKFKFLKNVSGPKYYLNSLLPVGKDKLLTFEPKKVFSKIKSIVTGQFFKYEYHEEGATYAGKGCVLDEQVIKAGSFHETEIINPIRIPSSNPYWQETVRNFAKVCKENNVEVVFYQMPSSDFYLNEKSNYQDYYSYVSSFVNELGYQFYDFNLAKKEFYAPVDEDFFDDNHLNKYGIEKYTAAFCTFFDPAADNKREDFFHNSYIEKLSNQAPSVYGLVILKDPENSRITIKPVNNDLREKKISYSYAIKGSEEKNIETDEPVILLSSGQSGTITIRAFLDGALTNEVTTDFVTF